MRSISYDLVKLEAEFKEAKITSYDNNVSRKHSQFPAVMFYARSKEDIDSIGSYYFQQLPNDHIFGFVMPLHKLSELAPRLQGLVPRRVNFMCDIGNEVFWYRKIKPEILKFHDPFNAIPSRLKSKINKITSTSKMSEKIEAHNSFYSHLIRDKSALTSVLTKCVNVQHANFVENISAFSPLLIDKEHLDLVEECYRYTIKLYHSSTNDIALNGRNVGIYTNFHTEFLSKSANISEFSKMIERTQPKFIVLKFFTIEDIRMKKTLKENYRLLIKNIANLSFTMKIPTFYFWSHSEGYISQTKGIDVFAEPLSSTVSTERELKEFKISKVRLKMLNDNDPYFKGGKIYDIRSGNFVNRKSFQKHRLTDSGIDSPIHNLAGTYRRDLVENMTDKTFRDFKKLLLMESRNYQENELHKGIKEGNIHDIVQWGSKWEGLDIPK